MTKDLITKGQVFTQTVDRLSVSAEEMISGDGYRLLWYHSSRKIERDSRRRTRQLQRAAQELTELRDRLRGPKSRFRERKKVDEAVQEILKKHELESLLLVDVLEEEKATYRQASKGRPSKNTKYVKQVKTRFDISWIVDSLGLAEAESLDGIFPLITNVREMTAEDILRAYRRQPIIEKRFSQLKTDFAVAPIYLKSVTRIQALLAVYFFVLIVQIGDLAQFIWGRLLGKHVIAPSINASRTWEGLAGGILTTMVFGALLWWATPYGHPLIAAGMAAIT
ncbi:MAG: phosphatidate cytidylyltransferase, partial [Pirellulaceae bacterium]